MIMSHILLWMVTRTVTMESTSIPHVFLHYIVGALESMLPSHQYGMLCVQGK
jgi:hypothetical protein